MTAAPSETSDPKAEIRSTWALWSSLIAGVVLLGAGAAAFVAWRGPFLVDEPAVQAQEGVGGTDPAAVSEAPAAPPEDDDALTHAVGTILGVLSIVVVGLSFVAPALSRRDPEPPRVRDEDDDGARAEELVARLSSFRRRSLLGWGLAEGAANLAVITIFLVGYGPLTVAALLLFAVQMMMTAPTRPRIREAVGDHFSLA